MLNNSKPNQPIILLETDIVGIDGQPVKIPTTVVFQLSPYPTVVIELEHIPPEVPRKEHFTVSMSNGAQLDAMCPSPAYITGKGSLTPPRLPADVFDKKVPLKSVRFGILNFPKFFGRQDRRTETETIQIRVPHVKLEASGWCVEITGVMNLEDVLKELDRDRGYGFTCDGVITRMDGATFSVEEVDSLLEDLRMFLSFVKGSYCSLALVEGQDEHGEQSWVRWGTHYVERWKPRRSWSLRTSGGDVMTELFPGFVSLLESTDQSRRTFTRVIDWYLESNESAIHVGLILTEAALERLSHHVLRRPRRTNKKESIAKYIENALEKLELKRNIPQGCTELRKIKDWASGPHAITTIRNDLVHPRQLLDDISFYAHHEAWNLGQWYVEMILLKEFCYQGSYRNRIFDLDESSSTIQPVPWAQVNDKP